MRPLVERTSAPRALVECALVERALVERDHGRTLSVVKPNVRFSLEPNTGRVQRHSAWRERAAILWSAKQTSACRNRVPLYRAFTARALKRGREIATAKLRRFSARRTSSSVGQGSGRASIAMTGPGAASGCANA